MTWWFIDHGKLDFPPTGIPILAVGAPYLRHLHSGKRPELRADSVAPHPGYRHLELGIKLLPGSKSPIYTICQQEPPRITKPDNFATAFLPVSELLFFNTIETKPSPPALISSGVSSQRPGLLQI